jgi:phage shock protein PspC (stress-responsive transcriptional regulator)
MNKTVTVNLGGIVFHIDEDAYEVLHQYLESIKGHFHTSEGKDEITSDIEARIAELFTEKLKSGRQVIVLADVNEAISVMGKPEDFSGEEKSNDAPPLEEKFQSSGTTTKRRVYRNGDEKIVGGVCSGISSYLDIDPLWLRLLFAVMFFGFGTGLLLYIILWIVIPEAKTTAQKLEMKGEKVNVENIEKNIKEEMDNLKKKFEDFKKDAKNMTSKDKTEKVRGVFGNIVHAFVQIVLYAVNVFAKFIGIFFIILGIVICIILMRLMLGISGIMPVADSDLVRLFFDTRSELFWASLGTSLLIGIPFLMLMYKGFRLLFNIKNRNKTLNAIAASFWIIGVVICSILFFNMINNYSEKAVVRMDTPIKQPNGDVLYLDVNRNSTDEWNSKFHFNTININGLWVMNGKTMVSNVDLKIQKSSSDKFELIKVQSSRGKTFKDASDAANAITSEVVQQDSLLILPDDYMLEATGKFRFQNLTYILKVPVGKSIYLEPKTKHILDDIDNVTDTRDADMVGRKWIMSDRGLKCVDCIGLRNMRYRNDED